VLAPAVTFHDFMLGIHILAVIVAFGILFLYPLMALIGARVEPAARPWWHRFQLAVHRRVQAPALVIVLGVGIYLGISGHFMKDFFVAWGFAAVVAIGAIGGALIVPQEKLLIEHAATGGPEYEAALTRASLLRNLQLVIVIATVILMALQP
jgi:hypothetical protein